MHATKRNLFSLFLCMTMVLVLLVGCARNEDAEPTIPRFRFQREKLQSLTITATKEDFPLLEECVNLEYLNFAASTCYDEILDYVSRHPNVEVVYYVPLGDMPVLFNDETEATLGPGSYTADSLTSQLKYLPNLQKLYLPKTNLTMTELNSLQDTYPGLTVEYSVDIQGMEILPDIATLEWNGPIDAALLAEKLTLLPRLGNVALPAEMTMEDVKFLMEQFPGIKFLYTFELFGKTLSTLDERVEYLKENIGDQGEDQIRTALSIMPNCTYFKLENCGLSNEVLAGIQADFPDTKIVWRVNFGGQYSLLTDETTLRTVYGVENSHNEILKYCTSLKYIDMGHNTTLTDISFASYMPDLEILILSGSSVTNVDALADCKNLVFLEMANCYALEDISGLKNCENLRFLNIGFSKVKDLSPIEDLPLERFIYLDPQIDKETQAAFEESHPDCWVRFTGSNPLSLGWKYDDIGITYSEYYKFIREVFNLDEVDRLLAQQAAREEAERAEQEKAEADSQPAASAPDPAPAPVPDPAPAPTPDAPAET